MKSPLNISFTAEELKEFGKLYLKYFDEEISQEELAERAEEYISFIYKLTNGRSLKVRSNNTALVTSINKPLNDE